jgi:hypothetical protein
MSDFRQALRNELVAAAARPVPTRRLPSRPVLIRSGAFALAVVAVALAVFVLPWGADQAPRPPAVQPAGVTGQPAFGGSLENGVRYRSRELEPAVSFVPSRLAWNAGTTQSPVVLELNVGSKHFQVPRLNRPQLSLTFGRLPQVSDPKTNEVVPAPSDLVAWLRAHPDLHVGAPVGVTLAGRRATRLDFTVAAKPVHDDPFCIQRFQFHCALLAPGASLRAGSAGRLYVVPARPNPLLVVLVSSDPRRLPALLKGSAGLLDSLRIGR